jgi:aryl-alcohol dehydrogenase-like predicted oxidoreductase
MPIIATLAQAYLAANPTGGFEMQTRRLGNTGPEVSAIGLGAMGMSDFYGPADRSESLATLAAAVEAGITLIDTGDFYGMGHNEMLIGEALKGHDRDAVTISVKFGAQRGPDGGWLGYDSRPSAVKTALAYSLKRLGVDHIDIYRPSRLDPAVPIEDTIGAIAEMVQAGYVRHIGLSEVGSETIRRAAAVHPISDLQIEYSLVARGLEDGVLRTTRELGIGITAYGVLARGLIGGHMTAVGGHMTAVGGAGDFRGFSPRFQGEALQKNLGLTEALRAAAAGLGLTPAQAAIAWVAAQGPDIVPLVGARRRDRLAESLGAMREVLSPEAVAALEAAVPKGAAAGERYPLALMGTLDSERG